MMQRYAIRPIRIDRSQARALVQKAMSQLFKKTPVGWSLGPAFHEILRGMPSRDEPLSRLPGIGNFGFEIGFYRARTVMDENVEVPVVMSTETTPTPAFIGQGAVAREAEGQLLFVVLYLNSRRTLNQIQKGRERLEKDLWSVLIHELTHVHDRGPSGLEKDYLEDPLEVRAFMQQVADDVLREWEENPRDIRELLQESYHWRVFSRVLKPAQKRLILRGIAQALEDRIDRG